MRLNPQRLDTRTSRALSGEMHASNRFLRHAPLALAMTVAVALYSPGASAASSATDRGSNIEIAVYTTAGSSDSRPTNRGSHANPANKSKTLRQAANEVRDAMIGFQQILTPPDQRASRNLVVQVE